MGNMPSLTDNILVVGYFLIWIATFLWYHHIKKEVDAGSMVIGSYIGYAFFSIITLNDTFFNIRYDHLRFIPFLYLYIMLMIALSPAIYLHYNQPDKIEDPHSKMLYIPCIALIISAFFQIPTAISGSESSMIQLITDADAGQNAYLEQISNKAESGSSIKNLPAVIFNVLYDCTTFLFFYFLTRKNKNKLFLLVLFAAIFIGMILPVLNGQRGSVIKAALTIVVGYALFRHYLSKRINRVVQIAGITMAIIIAIPITAITISRFSDRKGSDGVSGYVYWYIGQANIYFNNSAMSAGGIRYGDRTLNLFKRLIWSDTPKNYDERRDKYRNLEIDDYYFTTFVGDFALDFGPIASFFIFFIFNLCVLFEIRPRDGTIKLHQLLLIYFTLCICMQGGMVLFSYADTANLIIVVYILLYAWLRYHEALLKRFPLAVKE